MMTESETVVNAVYSFFTTLLLVSNLLSVIKDVYEYCPVS